MFKIIADDDVDAASFSLLESRGVKMRRDVHQDNGVEYDVAETPDGEFWGISPAEVLGMLEIHKARGSNWKPNSKENKRFRSFDKENRRETETPVVKELASELLKPKFIARMLNTAFLSGIQVFLTCVFGAFYFRDQLNPNAPLSWIALPLALYGLWKIFDRLNELATPKPSRE